MSMEATKNRADSSRKTNPTPIPMSVVPPMAHVLLSLFLFALSILCSLPAAGRRSSSWNRMFHHPVPVVKFLLFAPVFQADLEKLSAPWMIRATMHGPVMVNPPTIEKFREAARFVIVRFPYPFYSFQYLQTEKKPCSQRCKSRRSCKKGRKG